MRTSIVGTLTLAVSVIFHPITACAKPQVWRFNQDKWSFKMRYHPGGETNTQAKARTGWDFATNLTYFGMKGNAFMQLIDLFYKRGTYHNNYRWDWNRPILVIGKDGLRIDQRPKPQQASWEPKPGDVASAAIDTYEQPNRRMWRQMIAIRGKEVVIFKAHNATYDEIEYYVRHKAGFTDYASFDGGHSCQPGARTVTHFGAIWNG